jgi:hypothetical protein
MMFLFIGKLKRVMKSLEKGMKVKKANNIQVRREV